MRCAQIRCGGFLEVSYAEFHAVGYFFKEFSQVFDEEVMATIRKHESTLLVADHAARAAS